MTTPDEDPGTAAPSDPHAPLAPPVLEADQDAPPRPEEDLADAERADPDRPTG